MMTTKKQRDEALQAKREAERAARRLAHPTDCACDLCHLFAGPFPACACQSCTSLRGLGISSEHEIVVDAAELTARDGLTPARYGTSTSSSHAVEPATAKQLAFIAKLAAERGQSALAAASKRAASAEIERLLAQPVAVADDAPVEARWMKLEGSWVVKLPKSAAAKPLDVVDIVKSSGERQQVTLGERTRTCITQLQAFDLFYPAPAELDRTPVKAQPASSPSIPAGHYAVASQGQNDLLFVRVDHGKNAYAGRVFVKMIVGGHPDRNLSAAQSQSVLARIESDGIEVAARRYGQEIGRCCACNRELTDETSRAAGIGPECAKKF